jgi:hypothetical protein
MVMWSPLLSIPFHSINSFRLPLIHSSAPSRNCLTMSHQPIHQQLLFLPLIHSSAPSKDLSYNVISFFNSTQQQDMKALNINQPIQCSALYFMRYPLVLVLEAGWNHTASAVSISANGEYLVIFYPELLLWLLFKFYQLHNNTQHTRQHACKYSDKLFVSNNSIYKRWQESMKQLQMPQIRGLFEK